MLLETRPGAPNGVVVLKWNSKSNRARRGLAARGIRIRHASGVIMSLFTFVGTPDPRNQRSTEPLGHGTTTPRNRGTTEPRNYAQAFHIEGGVEQKEMRNTTLTPACVKPMYRVTLAWMDIDLSLFNACISRMTTQARSLCALRWVNAGSASHSVFLII